MSGKISASWNTLEKIAPAILSAGGGLWLEGPPGVAKTAFASWLAKKIGKPLQDVRGAGLDAVDVDGVPYVNPKGELTRIPYPPILRACEEPSLLFLDEITSTPPSTRAALMRVINERRCGEYNIHPDTVIMVAGNAPDECPSGVGLDAALSNRLAHIAFSVTPQEVADHFAGIGGWHGDLAATLRAKPDLIRFKPNAAAMEGLEPHPSPRAWDRGMTAMGHYTDNGGAVEDDAALCVLGAWVNEDRAIAYLSIRRLRGKLPTVQEICNDPIKAKLPTDEDMQIASLGLLVDVSGKDLAAAWVYGSRLSGEVFAAAAQTLVIAAKAGGAKTMQSSKWAKPAIEARAKIMARIGRSMGI